MILIPSGLHCGPDISDILVVDIMLNPNAVLRYFATLADTNYPSG